MVTGRLTSSHNTTGTENRRGQSITAAPQRASPPLSLAGIGSRDAAATGHSGNVGRVAPPLSVGGGPSGREGGADRQLLGAGSGARPGVCWPRPPPRSSETGSGGTYVCVAIAWRSVAEEHASLVFAHLLPPHRVSGEHRCLPSAQGVVWYAAGAQ